MKFTDLKIKRLQPKSSSYVVEEGLGFGVRIYPSGSKTWFYRFYIAGTQYRLNLGSYPGTSLAEAREKYKIAFNKKQNGKNPARDLDAETVAKLIPLYINGYAKKHKKSWEEDQRILTVDVEPAIGTIKLSELKRSDVRAMLDVIEKRGVNAAWQTLKVVRKMFNYALSEEMLEVNPCQTIKIHGLNGPVERNLSAAEIAAWWKWVEHIGTSRPIVNGLKFMLLTLQRTAETFGMSWEEIDGDWWEIPKERTKTKKTAHRVYLTPLAKSLLLNDKGLCFPSDKDGKMLTSYAVAQAARRWFSQRQSVLKVGEDKIPSFTPRDLRRTGVTRMAEIGVGEHIIGKVTNHAAYTITGRVYNKYGYDEEKKQALLTWEQRLTEIIG